MRHQGIPLGYETAPDGVFGFDKPPKKPKAGVPVCYDGDAPICVIASTGSGKTRGLVVPVLLTYPGPVIALDIKGELSAITRRARVAMGHKVAVIDPFQITGHESDRLNPLDLFSLPGTQLEADSEMIASMLGDGHDFRSDPYWTDSATAFISGLCAYAASHEHVNMRTIATVRKILYNDDTDFNLALLLDTKKDIPRLAYEEIAAYLQITPDKTRPCVLSTARTFMRSLNSIDVANCLEHSTISLADIVRGAPLDVFITIPPEKLKSHRGVLKLLVGTLMTAITRRKVIPEQRTLFVLDEAASLGKEFEPLQTAATLLRGYGMQMISIWQDLSQIKQNYPASWATILNNSAAMLAFGFGHYAACKEYSEITGLDPRELMAMPDDQAVLSVRGKGVRTVRRLDYLKDRLFEGKFDPNPFHSGAGVGI